MDEKLLRFFKLVNYNDVLAFEQATLKDMVVNRKENTWTLRIIAKEIIPIQSMLQLRRLCADGAEDVKKIFIQMTYEELNPELVMEYFLYYFDDVVEENPSLSGIDKDKIKLDDDIILIEVTSKLEENVLKKECKKIMKKLEEMGISGIDISFILNEKEVEKIKEQIEKEKADVKIPIPVMKEETKPKWQMRKKVEYQREGLVSIASLNQEENAVNLEAYIFDAEFTQLTKKDGTPLFLVTLKISDNSSSILGKTFAKDEEEFVKFGKELKKGKWFAFTGQVRYDDYAKDLVFQFKHYEPIDSPEIKRKDNALRKRVELHAHTMMSQMDGVCDENKLVSLASDWGHAGIAITDHDGCQSFPHVFSKVTEINKTRKKALAARISELETSLENIKSSDNQEGIEEIEKYIKEAKEEQQNFKPFKAGYGVELEMVESSLNVCFNASDMEIENTTFVIFDTETTGFNPGLGDSMIEIGGVKIAHGEVVDRFDELINPGHHIDAAITRVTNISDDDVKDADNEENVIKRFKEWIGSSPLVAHNARFDKNMLDMAYYKYHLGVLENPIIDTLMLSRIINRDLKKHSLKALGKFYGIDTGEAEDDENNENTETTGVKLEEEASEEIEDILVDGESILKVNKVEYQTVDATTETRMTKIREELYLDTVYKASKTELAKIEVKLKGECQLIDFNNTITLHPAENVISVRYMTTFGEKSIDVIIYVGQHHGADVDSENTGYIFTKMLKQIEGIKTLNELNDLGLLEEIAFKNDHKKLENIGDLCTFKNYIRPLEEEEEPPKEENCYPFLKYGNKDYVWKYPCCHENWLQMYENIPGKTYTEHSANIYDFGYHVTFIAKDHEGLKNLFKIISFANSNFIQRNAKIPRKLVNEYRKGLLVGSACLNGEIFYLAETRNEEELTRAIEFYDYIEVQPLENYSHLLRNHDINNMEHLKYCVKKIITCAKKAGKLIVATGDVHHIEKEDRLYREIIVNQNVPGKGRHPLARYLAGSSKTNKNKDHIERAIKKAQREGVELNKVDIKVLKYIYALTPFKDIPITSMNLTNLYMPDKYNQEEGSIKGKENEENKKYTIDTSLRKLQIAKLITVNYREGTYSLLTPYTETNLAEGGHIPFQHFRTTDEMLEEFAWLKDKELIEEIVIDNPNKLIDSLDELEVVVYPDKPFSPIIEHSQETCRDLVFEKAHSMYGNPLPRNIEERIAQEFYGDKINELVIEKIRLDHPEMNEEEVDAFFPTFLHEVIMSGYDGVVKLKTEQLMRENPDLDLEKGEERAKAELSGIIGGGFDVIYLIAQKLVKHSNDDGYLVGSRGSVGSSFVASMMGITECNGLPAHYYCPNCQYNEFSNSEGKPYAEDYPSGYDLPNKNCPKCDTLMVHQGNDMPFATFLGFSGEKVPDIDLNFSGDNQPSAHEYTKVLFGTDNVYRAGTIGTVAEKTAFGYVQGYFEERSYNILRIEAKSLGVDITAKDELKKKGLIKSSIRIPEVERLAVGCTGVKRTTGQHPGGIVVVPGYKEIWDFTPFQYPADDPTSAWRTTHFDYHAIDADLLKLDILGHDDPTVLRMLQDLSGIDVNAIDLGDLDTMKIFTGPEVLGLEKDRLRGLSKNGRKYCPTGTLGVPEFGTSFLLGMLEETKPTTFAELIKISGLSHGTDVWLGNARDLCTPDENGNILVPFKDVIGCRDDIMVNLIQWGMPPAKAFKIMEFVRKGKPSKDPESWKGFAETMREYNIPEWYIESCRKIKYMFPKAHATAYVTSAFRIAWFKVHHPIWYYCAFLSIRRDQFDVLSMIRGEDAIRDKIDEIDAKGNAASNKEIDTRETLCICLEMVARGFYFLNIDVEKSDAKHFVITDDGKGLIIPFRALDGLGDSVAASIVKARKEHPFISQEDLQTRGKVNNAALDKLKELGCLKNMSESNQLSLF